MMVSPLQVPSFVFCNIVRNLIAKSLTPTRWGHALYYTKQFIPRAFRRLRS